MRGKPDFYSAEIERVTNKTKARVSIPVEKELLMLYQHTNKGTVAFSMFTPSGIEQTHRISFDRPGVIQNLPNEIMHPYAMAAGLKRTNPADAIFLCRHSGVSYRANVTVT